MLRSMLAGVSLCSILTATLLAMGGLPSRDPHLELRAQRIFEADARLKKLTTGQATSLSMALKFRDPGLPEIIEKLEKTMRL